MINKIINFLDNAVSPFHTVKVVEEELKENGYIELKESQVFDLISKKYYIKRNDSSIIAFNLPNNLTDYSFNVIASHTDFPTFKLKPNADLKHANFNMLNTEPYGGMIMNSFFDRPLSLAGRVIVKEDGKYISKLINIDKNLLVIPNLAIHMNREVNNGYKINPQTELLPIYGMNLDTNINEILKKELKTDCLANDLYLYTREKASLVGLNDEFLLSSHLDNSLMVFTSLVAFVNNIKENSINVLVAYDNEETGSMTKQGAFSTFMKEVFERISLALGKTMEEHYQAVAKSFMVSADNAHAVHPNYLAKFDETNRVEMGKGLAIKYHSGGAYTTDSISLAIFKDIASKANKPVQIFTNRSDLRGGSTLGSISETQVAMNSVDVGIGQFAMHSIMETCSTIDIVNTIDIFKEFYQTHFTKDENNNIILN